jgi:formylglycine-generating enzyme required for sulfatase activity
MVVIPGPVEFLMGSPVAEEGRIPQERQHTRQIGRNFAIAAKPVKVREFRRFLRPPGDRRRHERQVRLV